MTSPTPKTPDVTLRDMTVEDLPILFEYESDPDVRHMAAFGPENQSDREAFTAHWTKNIANDSNVKKVIVVGGQVVGSMMGFELFGEPTVGYSIGKPYWGQGIASKALAIFLTQHTTRPLYARVVYDNIRSRRVLEKNGFVVVGEDTGFANARGAEVKEFILRLD
jgi:RimJ/RimL family protein N-acetyltransferase